MLAGDATSSARLEAASSIDSASSIYNLDIAARFQAPAPTLYSFLYKEV